MKALNKALVTGVAVIGLSFAALSPAVFADSPADIAGGNIYQIKNLTQNVNYANPASANACDELEYSIQLHNTAYVAATNVTVSVNLPNTSSVKNVSTFNATYGGGVANSVSGSTELDLSSAQTVSYIPGSAELLDVNGNKISSLSDNLMTSGDNIGSINGSSVEYVNFEAKVGCPTPATPVYTCNALTVTAGDNKTVTVSGLNTTAQNGATFTNATINWGDNSTPTTASNVVGQSHTYTSDGTYTITATANFNINGQNQTATSAACEQQVSFTSTTPPTVTPPTVTPPAAPTQLVNTGPGSTIGIFAAVVAISTVAYRFVIGRRLSRQ